MKNRLRNRCAIAAVLSLMLLLPGGKLFKGEAQGSGQERDAASSPEGGRGSVQALQPAGYESLMEAVSQAGLTDEQPEDSPSPELSIQLPKKLAATDGVGTDQFGRRVAISGDTAVVGAWRDDVGANADQGSAYVFVRVGTNWALQAKLTAADGAANDYFGYSVAITEVNAPAQTVIMVGAFSNDIGSNPNRGSVYVFVRSSGGNTWSSQGTLTASDGMTDDAFGNSVAMSGNFAIIGANGADIGANEDEGAAYIFVRSGTIWIEEQKLTTNIGIAPELNFGWSVAISGTMAIVGVNHEGFDKGLAVTFERVSSGNTWVRIGSFGGDGKLGYSVGISGTTVIIGAFGTDIGEISNQGKAYIYSRVGGDWTPQGSVIAPDGAANDAFGASVAISGELAIIGANGDDFGPSTDQGSAYVFSRSGTTWRLIQKLAAPDGAGGDGFGYSVALSGNRALVAAPFDDFDTQTDRGSAYVFTVSTPFDFDGDGKADVSVFRPSNGVWYLQQSAAGFEGVGFGQNGDRIVPADYDGDGKTDVAVYRNGNWYLLRSSRGFTAVSFGLSTDIPTPADFDGDGHADLAVFRPSDGTWYLQQSTNGFASVQFGQADHVPVAGDYDGDGRADVAVWDPANGTWYLLRSSLGLTFFGFGQSGDKPVPADYDGDGLNDAAVYRAGTWYLQRSSFGFVSIGFGMATDIPAAADYDGDGRADVAVFRPSNGTWYQNLSTGGFASVQFGAANDLAVPAAYVP